MSNKRKSKKKIGRPAKYNSSDVVQAKIDAYFDACNKNKEPYTICGLALVLNLDRKGLIEYSKKDEFSNTIKKAKLRIEEFLEKRLLSNACTPGVIFNLKNNFGWLDKNETNITGDIVINLTRAE